MYPWVCHACLQEFPGGITNGAQWYPLYGGAQDWSYLAAHVMELTIEVNQQKSPPAEELPRLWAENAPALLLYPMAAIMQGVLLVHALVGWPIIPLARTNDFAES